MARPKLNRPTDAELQILNVLDVSGESLSVRTIHQQIQETFKRGNGYNATLKIIQIMEQKGLLARSPNGHRPTQYRPTRCMDATRDHLLNDLANRAFGGDLASLIKHARRVTNPAKKPRQGMSF